MYDLTDLVLGGDFSTDEDLVAYSMALTANEYASSGKVIVLTEGRSDARILSESLALLYPHLADYFSFMDFEGVRIGGGAGSLVNIVKAFAGAGIVNRTVALFDNDTAARAALAGLRSIRLPSNIVVKHLPRLVELESYPTIGPTGSALMNVNDVAGELELYLGIRCVDGTVRHTNAGTVDRLRRWGGRISRRVGLEGSGAGPVLGTVEGLSNRSGPRRYN